MVSSNLTKIVKCNISSLTTYLTKIHRSTYYRTYRTLLVLPDGSTTEIRYAEPRMIIKLPLDLNTLSEDEKQLRLNRRKQRQKMIVLEIENVKYDPTKYAKLLRKK